MLNKSKGKEQRRVYVELANEMNSPVCCFCKFSECVVGESPCDCKVCDG